MRLIVLAVSSRGHARGRLIEYQEFGIVSHRLWLFPGPSGPRETRTADSVREHVKGLRFVEFRWLASQLGFWLNRLKVRF